MAPVLKQMILILLVSQQLIQSVLISLDSLNLFRSMILNVTRFNTLYYNEQEDNSIYGNPKIPKDETFDFIVVGSGPSGSVIANRLSEISDWNILLLEIGEEATSITDIPFLAESLQYTDYNWGYRAEKQNGFCLGCPDGRMWYPHGRALGGSSILSHMVHVRGNPLDYNKWAAMGNPGWSYKEVFPYFLKSEDADIERGDPGFHQRGGYLSVSDAPYRSEAARAFVKATQESGYPYVDYNGKTQIGVSYVQSTIKHGKRYTAEEAFLRPVRHRKNLKILTKARVVKVLIDPLTNEAYGVKYVGNKKYRNALVTKEVILCAGGLNTPQLLMLSGIGPRDHLQELGIPVLHDLPVGQKMYDHVIFAGLTFRLDASIVFEEEKIFRTSSEYFRFPNYGTGLPISTGGIEALAHIKTNASLDPHSSNPDTELIFLGEGATSDRGLIYRKLFSISQNIYDTVWKPLENAPIFQVIPMLTHPKSYGSIKLKSKNPYHWPKFYPSYFSDRRNQDIKTLIAAIREIQKIARSPALQRYGASIVRTPIPGCQDKPFDSDTYWECAIRHVSSTMSHQVATCKMGPPHDLEAVVHPTLRVYGIKNLRVADTSIIPIPLTAHTQEPAYMIGEKASDLIKGDWIHNSGLLMAKDIRRGIKEKDF